MDDPNALDEQAAQTDGPPSLSDETAESPAPVQADSAGDGQAGQKAPSRFSLSEIQENKGAFRIYMSLVERLNSVFIRIGNADRALDNRPINEIGASLLQVVRNQRDRFVGFILGSEVKGYDIAKNSINTAILSSLTAHELKLPHHRILHVITGALLHDAGMLRLPKEILAKRGGLSDAESKLMRNHPLLAYHITIKELAYPDEVGKIVLQHHERWDGTGYPNRMAGEIINPGAQVVSVADAFEAMVSKKPYRNPMTGYEAMKNLMADNSRRFSPGILKAFILTMGIHPLGSIVSLNSGVVARIVEVRANAPLRPKIQVLINESNQTPQGDDKVFIDLLTQKNLYITRAMEMQELSGRNV